MRRNTKTMYEWRKAYRDNDSRAFDMECRNHGGCVWCIRNRMYSYNKRKQAAIQKLKEYWQGDEQDFSKSGPSPFLLLSKKVEKLIDNLTCQCRDLCYKKVEKLIDNLSPPSANKGVLCYTKKKVEKLIDNLSPLCYIP